MYFLWGISTDTKYVDLANGSSIKFMWEDYTFVKQACHSNHLFKEGTPLQKQLYLDKNDLWMSKADDKGPFQALLTKRQVSLLTSSTETEWEEVSFSFLPPMKGEKLLRFFFLGGESEKLYEIFLKATSRHLRPQS